MPFNTQSLAEYLGIEPLPVGAPEESSSLLDITDAKEFGQAVLNSREFRQYIITGLKMGDLPGFATILKFFLEHACGKTPDKLELTGKDGQPVQTTIRIVRVVVDPQVDVYDELPRCNEDQVH